MCRLALRFIGAVLAFDLHFVGAEIDEQAGFSVGGGEIIDELDFVFL